MSDLDVRHTTALLLRKADNIAVVIADLSADDKVVILAIFLYTLTSNVPAKHKVAPHNFPVGDPVRAYGVFGRQEHSNFCPGLLKAGYNL